MIGSVLTRMRERVRLTASILVNQRRGLSDARGLVEQTSGKGRAQREPGDLEKYFDGHTSGPGIWKWRHYFDVYERHLERFRGTPVNMVEIGVYAGGSIGMWRRYFGDDCHIYGVDIDPECRVHKKDYADIFIGDQSDPAFWASFVEQVPEIDIVLDDGGHEVHQHVTSLESLLPHVRPGGVYICEDVVGIANPLHDYVSGLARSLSADRPFAHQPDGEAHVVPTEFQRSISSVHLHPFVVVIEKRADDLHLELERHGSEWPPDR